jgi:Tfp pilus assembly protein FimT
MSSPPGDAQEKKEGYMLKNLVLVGALLAMLAVAAVPAIGQVSQDFNQDTNSGDVSQSFNVSNSGSNGNQCVGITGNANTGNAQNQIGVLQYGGGNGDNGHRNGHRDRTRGHNQNGGSSFDFQDSGANLTVTGSSTTTCDQQVNQAAAAG